MKIVVLIFIILGVFIALGTMGYVLIDYIQEKKQQKQPTDTPKEN